MFDFTPIQTRTRFRSCIAICKKASMGRKCGSIISNVMDQSLLGLKDCSLLLSHEILVTQASEPSFTVLSGASTDEGSNSRVSQSETPENTKGLFVPLPKKDYRKIMLPVC